MGGPRSPLSVDVSGIAAALRQAARPGKPIALILTRSAIRAVGDAVVDTWPDRACRLVPAEGGLLPNRTVLDNLVDANRANRAVPPEQARADVHDTVTSSRLGDVLKLYPYALPPGRRRIAGVSRALCCRPGPRGLVLEDAPGLPIWGALLDLEHHPGLQGTALILLTYAVDRAYGFDPVDLAARTEQVPGDGSADA